jgi:hypothetical protein
MRRNHGLEMLGSGSCSTTGRGGRDRSRPSRYRFDSVRLDAVAEIRESTRRARDPCRPEERDGEEYRQEYPDRTAGRAILGGTDVFK